MISQKSKVKSQKYGRGFTLIESLVAIAVLMTGVSSAIFLINQSIRANTRTKNQIIAAYLAQEGIEIVRNIRDRNWMASRVWTTNIDALSNACVQWDTDYDAIDINCASGFSYLAFSGTRYNQTATPTQFKRTINTVFTPAAGVDPERLKVTSTVTCAAANCSVSLEEYLYNWK